MPLSEGSCSITNTLNTVEFTFTKVYSGGGAEPQVSVTLACGGNGIIVDNATQTTVNYTASWTVEGFTEPLECEATEVVPIAG